MQLWGYLKVYCKGCVKVCRQIYRDRAWKKQKQNLELGYGPRI